MNRNRSIDISSPDACVTVFLVYTHVQDLFEFCINPRMADRLFRILVLKPLRMESLYKLKVNTLSGPVKDSVL